MTKRLLTLCLLGILTSTTGCIFVSSDDPVGEIDVTWEFGPHCPTDASVYVVTRDQFSDVTMEDPFTCATTGTVTVVRDTGDYDVWVEVTDSAGKMLGQSSAVTASLLLDGDIATISIPQFQLESKPGDTGTLNVTWEFGPNCPPGANVHVITLDQATDAAEEDEFACATTGSVSVTRDVGDYDVWIEVVDSHGNMFGQSSAATATLLLSGDIVDVALANFLVEFGFFEATWRLFDQADQPVSCNQVFATGVELLATFASTSQGISNIWECAAGEGVTDPMLLGDYTIVMDILNEDNESLGTSQARDESLTVNEAVVDLGNFDFVFEL